MSIAGDIIREIRLEKKLSQTQLSERSNVDVSLISRFEKGRTETPSRDAMLKILKGLELHPIEFARQCHLRELKGQSASNDSFRIGWGHCIWGAPLVIPIYESASKEEALRNVSLTSYGVYDKEGNLTPYFYDQTSQRRYSVRPGPSFARCFDPERGTLSLNTKSWVNVDLKTFTADDILALYRTNKIDGLVVPNTMANAFVADHPDLMRCASIMFTGEACTFLVLWKDTVDHADTSENEVSQKYGSFRRFLSRQGNLLLTVFFARGTIAEVQLEDHMQDLVKAIRGKNPNAHIQPREVDLGNWNQRDSAFIHQFREEFEKRGIACFLGWEPHISWAIKEIRGSFEEEAEIVSHSIPGMVGSVPFATHYYEVELRELLAHLDPMYKSTAHHPLQFDMVVSQSAFGEGEETPERRVEKLSHFLSLVSNATSRIDRAQNFYNRNVQYIASYLDMPPDRCLKALRKLSFSLWFHPEWMEFSRRLASEKSSDVSQ